MTTVKPLLDEPIGTISPRIYGHFAEHLGRCCYDGLWVGTCSTDVPHSNGFRTDVVNALAEMPTPLLRWPGGCYADHYHWKDGVGPREERSVRLGLSCGLTVEDDNSLGTEEFLNLCRMIGAEPYLAGNMGSGSVQEMCDWLEYCNAKPETALVRERRKNGHGEPHGVKLWGVGNENWGCGGNYTAQSYALEYRRYATMLRHVDGTAELVACGFDGPWNRTLLETLRNHLDLVDHLSVHRYWTHGGPGTQFSESEYYALLNEADETAHFIRETNELLNEFSPNRYIGVALDEWGVWHPEARTWGPGGVPKPTPDYAQDYTLRDAIAAAVALEGFHRQCKALSLANLAQIVNVLHAPIATSGGDMWLTPTYHLLRLHATHVGATALRTSVETPEHGFGGPAVSATASMSSGALSVTVTNRHYSEPSEVMVHLPQGNASCQILSGPTAAAQNSAAEPCAVQITDAQLTRTDEGYRLTMPPHSVATLSATA